MANPFLSGLSGIVLCLVLSACATTEPQQSSPTEDWLAQQVANSQREPAATPPRLISRPEVFQGGTDEYEEIVELFPGTGRLINTEAAKKPVPITEIEGEVTLNFEQADIRDVVKVIFDTLQQNYVIDSQVQGEVTIQTSRPLPKNVLLPTLEALLSTNNAALIQAEGVYKIVPVGSALPGNLSPRLGSGRSLSGYSVQIIPLRYISALEMEKILQPFVPEGSIISVDIARNLLMLAGTARELANAQETIEIFDVNWLKGMSVAMYTLQNVESDVVATELGNLFGEGSNLPISGLIRFVPISKLNAVIAITQQPEYLEEIGFWIERFDSNAGERLYVYPVQFGTAEYIASLLSEIFGGEAASVGSSTAGQVAPGLTPTQLSTSGSSSSSSGLSNSSSSSGLSNSTQQSNQNFRISEQQQANDQPSSSSPSSSGFPSGSSSGLSARPSSISQSPQPSSVGGGGSSSRFGGAATEEVRIIADTENNALLIWANKQDYQKILSALSRIDVPALQVLVEVTIAEVTLTGNLTYGVQWWFKNGVGDYLGIGSQGINTNVNVDDLGRAGAGFVYTISDEAGIVRALLDALASESKLRVLSSPQVMVVDNQEATIRVGNQQPVLQGTSTTDGGTTTQNIQFKDTGVILTVAPQINAGGLVTMDVNQEVISVGPIDEATGQRSFFERTVQSKVAIQSGESIVLGGLISESVNDSSGGIPVLYKIPVVGPLFGGVNNETDRTELLVLITPRIIRDNQEAKQVTKELKQRMKEIEPFIDFTFEPKVIISPDQVN
ncbi:MAG: type II secretion system secretin GspD, partial [Candidatus Competibacteraceae bacterium]|nr:type II secretion system secretin GspD [Candidatus Competibacteraceae bacterium]